MAVRNFWVEADIDGRKTQATGGPQSKEGGMLVKVYVRQDDNIEVAAVLRCRAREDGRLSVRVVPGPNVKADRVLGSRPGFVVESKR